MVRSCAAQAAAAHHCNHGYELCRHCFAAEHAALLSVQPDPNAVSSKGRGLGWAPQGGRLAGFGGALLLLGVVLLGMLKLEGSWVSQLAG